MNTTPATRRIRKGAAMLCAAAGILLLAYGQPAFAGKTTPPPPPPPPADPALTFVLPGSTYWDVHVMNADGSNDVSILPGMVNTSFCRPRFSPDGQQVVFAGGLPGSTGLYVMDKDGGNLRFVTPVPSTLSDPTWSPVPVGDTNEHWLLFRESVMDPNGNNSSELFVVNLAGDIRIQLTDTRYQPVTDEYTDEFYPMWFPDATRIAYKVDTRGPDVIQISGISLNVVVNGDGSTTTTAELTPISTITDFTYVRSMDMAATQDKIVCVGDESGVRKLAIVDLTQNPAQLTFFSDRDYTSSAPCWTEGDTRIAYIDTTFGNKDRAKRGIYTMDLNGGNRVQVSSVLPRFIDWRD